MQQGRPTQGVFVPTFNNPALIKQLAQNRAGYRHTAHLLDVTTGDGLTIGDDAQRFKQGLTQRFAAFGKRAANQRAKFIGDL